MPAGAGLEIAAHRHALGVANYRRAAGVGVGRREVVAAEEADDHARAGRRVGLAALHGVEDRLARVLGRPDCGVARSSRLPAHDHCLLGFDEGMVGTVRARFGAARLAEEIVLLDGRQTRMCVGRADHAELVRIDAEFALELQAEFQRRAGILVLEHLRFLQFAQIEVALVPALEIGELVVRRQVRVRLAVALDLGRFVEPLPFGARLGVLAVDRLAGEGFDYREHAPVGKIAVMGDGKHACPRSCSS